MGIVEQMRSFESDHEPGGWPAVTMGQISALCDEVERLQSIIDEANAQEADGVVCNFTWYSCEASAKVFEGDMKCVKMYARPIPAQQSPRITEQDALPIGYREEWKRNVMLMWSCVRKHDSSIPSDVLDYMREQLLNKLNEAQHGDVIAVALNFKQPTQGE